MHHLGSVKLQMLVHIHHKTIWQQLPVSLVKDTSECVHKSQCYKDGIPDQFSTMCAREKL